MSIKSAILLVNFGGPRNLEEVQPFLTELLTDIDVIRTPFPRFFERWLFKKVAIKRSEKVLHDYAKIGGKSPIFEDTEAIAAALASRIQLPVLAFHRYLPATHSQFFNCIRSIEDKRLLVLPMYPQFSYSTTGSVARFFSNHLSHSITQKMHWIKSYGAHICYVQAMQNCIRDFLASHQLKEEEVFLFFSAHGLPKQFIEQGDPYEEECHHSYQAIREAFPKALSLLAFQSKFGPGEWLHPYTSELCAKPSLWRQSREHIVFVPLTFTTDHLETLFEIEETYLSTLRHQGLYAYRCPALNRRSDWINALASLLQSPLSYPNHALIRKK